MSDKIELNRRRVLGGLVTIGAAGAAVGAGTFALFSDEETSDGNSIEAGTLNLQSATSDVIDVDTITPGWGPESYDISTTYDSESDVDPVDLSLRIELSEEQADAGDLSVDKFGRKIQVTTADIEVDTGESTRTYDILDQIDQTTEDHPESEQYYDLTEVSGEYADFDTASPGDDVTLTLELQMPSNVGNEAQGERVDIQATFEAEQQDN